MLKTAQKLFEYVNSEIQNDFKVDNGNHSLEVVKLDSGNVFRFKYHGSTIVSFKLNNSKQIVKSSETFISDCGYDTNSTKRAIGAYIELIFRGFTDPFKHFKVDSEYAERTIHQIETLL